MPMYNLREFSDTYSKTSEGLWQYHRDKPALNSDEDMDFPADNNSILFKSKQQITRQTGNNDIKDVEIMVLLKYLSNFWTKLKMPLIKLVKKIVY